jgi:hypothetical protein
VSFPSEPGRDDGSLPPVNVVIPDDARELDRDVLAYRRELRARRRRERLLRLLRSLSGGRWGSGAAIIPLIAACLALSLVGGALLSVMTISPAHAPTVISPRTSPSAVNARASLGQLPVALPTGSVLIDSRLVAVRSLVGSVIAVIPGNCDCGAELTHLADLTYKAGIPLYFAGTGTAMLAQFSAAYSRGRATAAADPDGVLQNAFRAAGLLVLLVFNDATAIPLRKLPADSKLTAALGAL